MADVGIYVQSTYAKTNYANESYETRAWPGLEMVRDALTRAGIETAYCSAATVGRHKIILVSMTSQCDWWSFVGERTTWKYKPFVLVGGTGCLNVRPFLRWADAFWFGRAEDHIVPLVRAILSGKRYEHASICYVDEFDDAKEYSIQQAERPYPHPVALATGKEWIEDEIGCHNRCGFCSYTWHRRGQDRKSYGSGKGIWTDRNTERTIRELLSMPDEQWQTEGQLRMVGLDGTSQRIRMAINKKITREHHREFLARLLKHEAGHQVKVYNIVGYPTETIDDWREYVEDLVWASQQPQNSKWGIAAHFTPFRPMPATPLATWPTQYRNFRGEIAKHLKTDPKLPGNVIIDSPGLWAFETMGTESIATVAQDLIVLRGTEDDAEIIQKFALSKRYWSASVAQKMATLEKHFDMGRLFGGYSWDELPTRYLHTWCKRKHMEYAGNIMSERLHGEAVK